MPIVGGDTAGASVVKALVDHANGEVLVRAFAEARYTRDHGAADRRLAAQAKTAGLHLQEAAVKKGRADREATDTPPLIEDPATAGRGDGKGKRPFVVFLWFMVIALSVAELLNLTRYAVDFTQNWPLALLFCFALPAAPLVAEYLSSKAIGWGHHRKVLRWLSLIGGLAFALFMLSFAREFAVEPSLTSANDLLRGADRTVLLISQTVLAFICSTVIFLWIDELTRHQVSMIQNPRSLELEQRQAVSLDALCSQTERLGEIEAEIAAYEAHRRVHMDTAIALYHQFRKKEAAVEEILRSLSRLV